MRRIIPAAFACALVIGACNGGDDSTATLYGGYAGFADGCQAFTSCTTCTPVTGCGWCFDSDGTGMCAASPDECATPAFSWTWNPSGCRVAADASTVQVAPDTGAAPEVEEDATASGESSTSPSVAVDAGRPAADGAVSTDGASTPREASVADGALDDGAPE